MPLPSVYNVLKANGIRISPDGDEDYVRNQRANYYLFLWLMSRTFIGRLAASDHAMHAVLEMTALSNALDTLKKAHQRADTCVGYTGAAHAKNAEINS